MKEKIYLKSINTGMIVELHSEQESTFSGIVVEQGRGRHDVGDIYPWWVKDAFNTISYNPNKKDAFNAISYNSGQDDRIVISDSENFICISVCRDNDEAMSWEYLQGIKDKYHPDLEFMEVYPCKGEIINKANERHLLHQKGVKLPSMGDLEEPAEVIVIEK